MASNSTDQLTELLEHHKLSKEVLNNTKVIKVKGLQGYIAPQMTEWEEMFQKFGLESRYKENIKNDAKTTELQKAKLLDVWIQNLGFKATVLRLIEIFIHADRNELADSVCEFYKSEVHQGQNQERLESRTLQTHQKKRTEELSIKQDSTGVRRFTCTYKLEVSEESTTSTHRSSSRSRSASQSNATTQQVERTHDHRRTKSLPKKRANITTHYANGVTPKDNTATQKANTATWMANTATWLNNIATQQANAANQHDGLAATWPATPNACRNYPAIQQDNGPAQNANADTPRTYTDTQPANTNNQPAAATQHDATNEQQQAHRLHCTCICIMIAIGLFATLPLITAIIGISLGATTYKLHLPSLDASEATIIKESIVYLEKVDPFSVESVTFEGNKATFFYIAQCIDFTFLNLTLEQSKHLNVTQDKTYAASQHYLLHGSQLNAQIHLELNNNSQASAIYTECLAHIHIFHTVTEYLAFLQHDKTSRVMDTICLKSETTNYTVTVDEQNYYLTGLHIPDPSLVKSVEYDTSGYKISYNISNYDHPDCTLLPQDTTCTLPFQNPGVHHPNNNVCILAETPNLFSQVTYTVKERKESRSIYNGLIVGGSLLASVCIIFIFTFFTFACVLCVRAHK